MSSCKSEVKVEVIWASRFFWPFVLPVRAQEQQLPSLIPLPFILSSDWSVVSGNISAFGIWLRVCSHWAMGQVSVLHMPVLFHTSVYTVVWDSCPWRWQEHFALLYNLFHRNAFCRIFYLEVFAQKKTQKTCQKLEGFDGDLNRRISGRDGMMLRKFWTLKRAWGYHPQWLTLPWLGVQKIKA